MKHSLHPVIWVSLLALLGGCGGTVQRASPRGAEGGAAATSGVESSHQGGDGASATGSGGSGGSVGEGAAAGTGGASPALTCDDSDFAALADCGWETIAILGVSSCELEVTEQPDNPDRVNIAIDCNLVPQVTLDADGNEIVNWAIDYSTWPAVLRIEGEPCQRLRNGEVRRIDIVMGCPMFA
jgi:hypothetical protein